MAPPGRRERRIGGLAVFVVLSAVSLVATLTYSLFDDEIFTIDLIGLAGGPVELWQLANRYDVHPPLGYLLTAAAAWLGLGWIGAKAFCGVLTAASLGFLAAQAGRVMDRRAFRFAVPLLALAASTVMWGASLRWYGWFMPIFWALAALTLFAPIRPRAAIALLALGGAILLHIGYMAMIAMPALALAAAWVHRDALARGEWRFAVIAAALAALVCAPQLHVLMTVHSGYTGQQLGGIVPSAAMSLVTTGWGNSFLPLSPAFFVFAGAGVAALFGLSRLDNWRAAMPLILLLGAGLVLLVLSGTGYRHRNSLWLHPFALLLMALGLARLRRGFGEAAFLGAAGAQAIGAANVAAHHDTLKTGFERPHHEAAAAIASMSGGCAGLVALHHDRVLYHLLRERRIAQASHWSSAQPLAAGGCIAWVGSWGGDFGGAAALFDQSDAIRAADLRLRRTVRLGRDRSAALRGRLTGDVYPEWHYEIRLLQTGRAMTVPRPIVSDR